MISPDTGADSATYDEAGNLKTQKNAKGKVTSYQYDALNRLTTISYASGTPTIFIYDGGTGNTVKVNIGHLTQITDEAGTTRYNYDSSGRVVTKTQALFPVSSALTKIIQYGYGASGTANGKLNTITYPSGNRVNYTFNATGQIQNITVNPVSNTGTSIKLMSGITYTPTGQFYAGQWGNHSTSAWNAMVHYDDLDGRVYRYHLGNPNQGGLIRTVNFDAASRVTSLTHTGTGAGTFAPTKFDQTYSYDNLDRLTGYTGSTGGESYTYDESGNRTSRAGYSFIIDAFNNHLTNTLGPVPIKNNQYDTIGNLLSDGTVVYTYSDRNRLQKAQKGSVIINYAYNGLEQRVKKTGSVSTALFQYVYDEQGHLIGEYDYMGSALQETVYLGDMPIAVLKQTTAGTDIYYIYTDHLNTPRVITRATDNQIVWRWDNTDPFGATQPNQNPSGLGAFTYNPRFPGQVYDAESGLYYNYHRHYDPKTGRYTQSDPIGLAGGINTYAYVGGNPVGFVDPRGLFALPLAIPIGQTLVDAATVVLGGAMIADSFSGKEQRKREHAAYKEFQRQGYDKDNDPCKELRNKIDYHQELIKRRDAWDKNWPHPDWPNGRHAKDIADDSAKIERWEREYQEKCGKRCE